jgi:hypothetical protein
MQLSVNRGNFVVVIKLLFPVKKKWCNYTQVAAVTQSIYGSKKVVVLSARVSE